MSLDLTSDEASALDEAIRASGAVPNLERSAADAVQPFDLTGSRQVNRSLPSLNVLDDRTAGALSLELTRALRTDFRVSVVSGGIARASTFFETLEAPGCLNVLQFDGLAGHGVLAVENGLLFSMLERMFGGRKASPIGGAMDPAARGRLSAIEQTVVRRLVRMFSVAMEASWSTQVPVRVRLDRTEQKAGNLGIAKGDDNLVATTFAVRADGLEGNMHFALPLSALDAHKEELDVGGERSEAQDRAWRKTQEEAIRGVRVDVVAELGRAHIPLRQLLRMQPGEVLRLDQAPDDPVVVRVEGVAKFTGQPTVRYGNLAIELSGTAPHPHEPSTIQGVD